METKGKTPYWWARFVSRSRLKILGLFQDISSRDDRAFRFRPLEVKKRMQGSRFVYYLDAGDVGYWEDSPELAYANNAGLGFEVYFIHKEKGHHHVVFSGKKVTLAETFVVKRAMMSPQEILSARRKDEKEDINES